MNRPFVCDGADLFPGEGSERFAAASARFAGTDVRDPASPAFDEAYGAMWAYFGPKNEVENRAALADWLGRPIDGRVAVSYHLLSWHDRVGGALVGVRDCFVGVDLERHLCVVLLSHSFVPAEHRRSGVATLIRTAPANLARRELARHGLDPHATPILLVAEMEPVVPSDRGSIVRMLSYGRCGYAVIPPSVLPYCQPDFRDLAALRVPAEPIPMPCVVRWLDHEADGCVPTVLVDALVEILALLHLRACEPTHVTALAAADRARLARYGQPTIPLMPLPATLEQLERLEPLLRSHVLTHYPERYRVGLVDPAAERSALRAAAAALAGDVPVAGPG